MSLKSDLRGFGRSVSAVKAAFIKTYCARGLLPRPTYLVLLMDVSYSKDCPIFYMRKKVQKDITDQQATVDRFGDAW